MPENQGGKTIMFAPWPKPLDDDFKGHYGLDDCYLQIAGAKYDLVTEGRNLRAQPTSRRTKSPLRLEAGKLCTAPRRRSAPAVAQRGGF